MEEHKDNTLELSSNDATAVNVEARDFMIQEKAPIDGTHDQGEMTEVVDNSQLQRFLTRDVKIADLTWDVGQEVEFLLNPWSLFLDKAAVRNKLQNYARLRGTLVVRLNISASQFHYGLAKFVYRPTPGYSAVSDKVFNFAVPQAATDPALCRRMVYSQLKRGTYFNPGYDTSVELRLPYISPFPGIDVSFSNTELLGELAIMSFTELRHAQGTSSGVRLVVMAHMEDVVLDVPTYHTL